MVEMSEKGIKINNVYTEQKNPSTTKMLWENTENLRKTEINYKGDWRKIEKIVLI